MKQLTEELFSYSMILSAGDIVLESVDMVPVLEESVAGFYGPMKVRGIEPVIHMPEGPVIRWLNRAALSRIFGNILSNALKYSAGDLEIILLESGEVRFSNSASDLNDVQVGRLFDRFFTVEAARSSTGLGLAIAKTLVERMDGIIGAELQAETLTIHISFGA